MPDSSPPPVPSPTTTPTDPPDFSCARCGQPKVWLPGNSAGAVCNCAPSAPLDDGGAGQDALLALAVEFGWREEYGEIGRSPLVFVRALLTDRAALRRAALDIAPASDAPAPPRETTPTRIVGGIEWFTIPCRVEGGVNLDAEEDCQCARCGSSCAWLDCGNCGGDDEALGSDCIDDLCHGGECMHGDSGFIRCDWCRGTGGSWHCVSGPEWCEANPLPGRESITSTALRAEAWDD